MATIEESSPEQTTLYGTAGDDTFQFSGKFGQETIEDAGGSDTLWFQDIEDPDGFSVTRTSTGVRIEHDSFSSDGSVTINLNSRVGGRFTINYGADTETWGILHVGSSRGGTLRGGDEIDFMYGTGKKDRFYGGDGDDYLYGGAGKDKLYGEDGDDILDGGEDDDKLYGGDGDDIYIFRSGDGEDEIEDIEGDEELYFLDATGSEDFAFSYDGGDLIVTVGDDSNIVTIEDFDAVRYSFFYGDEEDKLEGVVLGTSKGERLEAEDDGDALYGGAGNDTLVGGAGDNMLDGGDGDDIYILRGGGNDLIQDADGQESLYFRDARGYDDFSVTREANGDVRIAVGSSSATILAASYEQGSYALFYGSGNSPLGRLTLGDSNDEALTGSAEADWIIGGAGNDRLKGDGGDDRLDGGAGNDVLIGGDGSDVYVFSAGDSGTGTLDKDLVEDEGGKIVFRQGDGNDYEGATYTLNSDGTVLTVAKGGNRLNVIEFSGAVAASFSFYTSDGTAETQLDPADFAVEGTPDTTMPPDPTPPDPTPPPAVVVEDGSESSPFLATDVADSFTGSEGADWVSYTNAGSEGVVVDLDTGTVERTYAAGDVFSDIRNVIGSGYGDVLTGSSWGNVLRGEGGDDRLYGGRGVDTLVGGADADTLDGGEGDDILVGGAGTDIYVFDGEWGADTIQEDDDGGFLRFLSAEGIGDFTFWRADNNDAVITTVSNSVTGSVTIAAAAYGHGHYTLQHTIQHGSERGTIKTLGKLYIGTSGNDNGDVDNGDNAAIVGSDDADLLLGLGGEDLLQGNEGADRLYGGDKDDILQGGAGADELYGGRGADTLQGGDGDDADTLVGGGGGDILEGGGGADTYVFAELKGADTIRGDTDGGTLQFKSATGFDDLVFSRDDNNNAVITFDANSVTIEDYAHGLYNLQYGDEDTPLGDLTYGTREDDDLTGSGDADLIVGGDNNDMLKGGAGADRLYGGRGVDTLEGGAGADFLDGGGGKRDTISYENSDALVNVNLAANTLSGGHATDSEGMNDRMAEDSFENIIGSRYDDNLRGDERANTLTGGVGADTLDGGEGDDILVGGAGTDIYVFDGEWGADTIRGDTDGGNLYFKSATGFVGFFSSVDTDNNMVLNLGSNSVTIEGYANALYSLSYGTGDMMRNFGELTFGTDSDDSGDNPAIVGSDDVVDLLLGFGGEDLLQGNDGDDTLVGGLGNDIVAGRRWSRCLCLPRELGRRHHPRRYGRRHAAIQGHRKILSLIRSSTPVLDNTLGIDFRRRTACEG